MGMTMMLPTMITAMDIFPYSPYQTLVFFISTFGYCTEKLELDTNHSELTDLHVCKFRAAA